MTNNVNIAEKLMVVRLNCSFSFGRVTDNILTAEVNHAKKTRALQVKKELLPADSGIQLRALHAVLSSFYGYHKKLTMSSVNEGERLMPVAFYLDYMNEFGVYNQLKQEAFDTFVQGYPNAILLAQQPKPVGLGDAFNAGDYPPASELASYLKFKVQTLPLPQASTLLNAVGEGIQSDVDAFLSEALDNAFTDIHARMKAALERMVAQLGKQIGVNKKGEPVYGRIYDTLVDSVKELVSFIPEFNVTDDDSLKLLAEEVKTQLLVYTPDMLRTSPEARQATAAAAQDILRRMA